MRIFIKDFAHRAHHLVKLTRKEVPFEWSKDQRMAQENLKQAVIDSPAICAINNNSDTAVILSVDTSSLAIRHILSQCDPENPKIRYYSRFGSITLNRRKARFSQSKLELYGVYCVLKAWKLYLIGVCNLIIEVDAQHIKGMLKNPNIALSASVNRWIALILIFHFTLVYVPGIKHGPDGLSRWPRQSHNPPSVDDDDEETFVPFLTMHILELYNPARLPLHASFQLLDMIVPTSTDLQYAEIPHAKAALDASKLQMIPAFLERLKRLPSYTDKAFKVFVKFAAQFFVLNGKL